MRVPELVLYVDGADIDDDVEHLTGQLTRFSPRLEPVCDSEAFVLRLARVNGLAAAGRVALWLAARLSPPGTIRSRRPRIGIGPNVLVACTAARTADGGGIHTLDALRYREAVGSSRVRQLEGVTPGVAAGLEDRGIFTIGQLALADPEALGLGSRGYELVARARGEEISPVVELVSWRTREGSSLPAWAAGGLGERIRERLASEGRAGEWMVVPLEPARLSA